MNHSNRSSCPHCQQTLETTPALFSFRAFACTHCESSLQTNLLARCLYLMTFTALAFYYVGAMQGWLPNTSNVQSITLTAIVIPVLTSIVLPRYQAGHQQAPVSLAVNVAFCINIAILIYLWAN